MQRGPEGRLAAERQRDIRLVSPEEIVLAAHTVDPDATDVNEELILGTSRLLGFRRTGKDVHAIIRSVLEEDFRLDNASGRYVPGPSRESEHN